MIKYANMDRLRKKIYLPLLSFPFYKDLFLLLVVFIYSFSIFQSIFVKRALFYDGSYFFISVLQDAEVNTPLLPCNNPLSCLHWPYFDDIKHQRLFTNLLNQSLVSGATYLHVKNLEILLLLFAIPLFTIAPLSILLTHKFIHQESKYWLIILPIASYVLFTQPSEIFILNPAITFTALSWFIALLYLGVDRLKISHYSLILMFVFYSLRGHENNLLLSPILAFIAFYRFVHNKEKPALFMSLLHALSAFFSYYWMQSHPIGEQTSGYFQTILTILKHLPYYLGNTGLLFSLLALVVLVLFFVLDQLMLQKQRIVSICLFSLIFVIDLLQLVNIFTSVTNLPAAEYELRIFITLGSLALMIVGSLLLVFRVKVSKTLYVNGLIVLGLTMSSQAIWQIQNNVQWYQFYRSTQETLSTHQPGKILITDQIVHADRYTVGWTWPAFSFILQGNKISKIILPPLDNPYYRYIKVERDHSIPVCIPFSCWPNNSHFNYDILRSSYDTQ